MPAVGRNSPCPCGSGRKYKNCCMRRNELDRSQLRGANLMVAALMSEIEQFTVGPEHTADVDAAFEVYWGGAYDTGGFDEADRGSMLRWLEWFALDYRVGPERRRPIELYAEGPGRELPDEDQPLLAAISEATVGLYRVQGAQPPRLTLLDVLRDQTILEAEDAVLARSARPGDVLVARAYTLEGTIYLTSASLLLPGEFEVGMAEYVRNAYRTFAAERGKATWDDFFRNNGHIMMAYLLSYRAEALRALIGPGTRFHDPLTTRDKLREFTRAARARQEEAQRQQEEAEYLGAPAHRTTSGLLLLGDEEPEPAPPAKDQEEPRRPTILLPGRDG